MKHKLGYAIASLLVGMFLLPIHHYNYDFPKGPTSDDWRAPLVAGVYVEPVFADGSYCGFEYRGAVGFFCAVDN